MAKRRTTPKTSGRSIVRFDTVGDLIAHCKTPTTPDMYKHHNPASANPSQPWNGNVTLSEAYALAVKGWPEGADMVRERTLSRPAPIAPHWDPVIGDEGDEVCVDRWMGGDPEHWMRLSTTPKTSPATRTLLVNGTCSSGVSAATIIDRGVAVCRVIDAMETAGERCEVWITWALDGEAGITHEVRVKIKVASEPMDMDRVAYWLCHPSAMRRIIIRHIEHVPARSISCSLYGRPCEADPQGGEIYFPQDPDAAIRAANDMAA